MYTTTTAIVIHACYKHSLIIEMDQPRTYIAIIIRSMHNTIILTNKQLTSQITL
jgi:hypothetical protein